MKFRFNSIKNYFSAILLGLSSLMLSCSDEDDNSMTPTNTIVDIVVGSQNFSTLEAAVLKGNVASTLSGEGPFTVFAPDNESFTNSGITSSILESLSADQVKDILLYHTLSARVNAESIQNGTNAVKTANGKDVYVTKNSNGVYVNGWKVTQADIAASNGVIHAIERVLMPASGNLVEVAQGNQNLSYLVAAVLRASQGTTNVAQVLGSAGPYTVFAPTNQAFIDAGFPTIASIQAADPNTLAGILTYHVLSARAFSSDLTNGQTLNTVNGGTLAVQLGTSASIKGNSNSTAAQITGMNIMATNGVVHLIDKVLLP